MAIPVLNSVTPSVTTPATPRLDPSSPGYIAEVQAAVNDLTAFNSRGNPEALSDVTEVRPFISALSTSSNNLLGELNDQLNTQRIVDGIAQPEAGAAETSSGAQAQAAQAADTQPEFAVANPAVQLQTGNSETTTSSNAPVTSFDPADSNLDGTVSPQEDFQYLQQNPADNTAANTQAPAANTTATGAETGPVSAQENTAFQQQQNDVLDNGSLNAGSDNGLLAQQAAERQNALLTNTYGVNANLGGEQTSSGGILSLAA